MQLYIIHVPGVGVEVQLATSSFPVKNVLHLSGFSEYKKMALAPQEMALKNT